MESREAKIAELVNHLVTCLNRNASESLREQTQSYARKIFSSSAGRPQQDTLPDLKDKITLKVAQTYDNRSVMLCQDITQRLINNPAIYRKAEVLRMLLKLSDLQSSPS
jgi:hypothetical protein